MLRRFDGVSVDGIIGASGTELIDIALMCERLGYEPQKTRRFIKSLGFEQVRLLRRPQTVSDLAQAAVPPLLEALELEPDSLDAFIFVTQSQDYIVPAPTYCLQQPLGLSEEVLMLDLVQGCTGFVYGLFYAATLLSSGVCNKVLVCAGDTSGYDGRQKGQEANDLLFGDGLGAAVLSRRPDAAGLWFSLQSHGALHDVIIEPNGRSKYKRSLDYDQGHIEDTGTFIDGPRLADYVLNSGKADVLRLLERAGLKSSDISYCIAHQANKTLLKALAGLCALTPEQMPFLAAHTGNTSSASIPLSLSESSQSLSKLKEAPALLCSFGVGMAVASALVDLRRTQILPALYLD